MDLTARRDDLAQQHTAMLAAYQQKMAELRQMELDIAQVVGRHAEVEALVKAEGDAGA